MMPRRTSKPPRVSICVPTWNGASHLGETLESALSQTFEDFELILVDDGSTDGTADILAGCRDPRARIVRNERRRGLVGNWNHCLELASAEYVKFLLQDDTLTAHALAKLVEAVESHPDTTLSFGRRRLFAEAAPAAEPTLLAHEAAIAGFHASTTWPSSGAEIIASMLGQDGDLTTNVVGEPSFVLFRRQAALRHGPFDARLRQLVDWEYWLRLASDGRIAFVDEPLGVFRVHDRSETARNLGVPRRQIEAFVFLGIVDARYRGILAPVTRRRLRRQRWNRLARLAQHAVSPGRWSWSRR